MPRKKTETEMKEKKEEKTEEEKKITKKELLELAEKKLKILEIAKKLAEKIEEKEKAEDIKEKVEKKEEKTLIPLDDYIKAGVYIGTKVITPHMRKYVYRRRADGIAIINTNIIDEKIRETAEILAKYEPENFIVVCKREAGWKAVKLFSELTGVRVFTKKYPAGIITNLNLSNFFETDLIFICDPWLDKNALNDAIKVKIKVISVCDTNNYTFGVDYVLPANNKSNKSLGVIFYILTREYMKAKKIDKKLPEMEEFIGEKLEELPEREKKKKPDKSLAEDKEKIDKVMKEEEE